MISNRIRVGALELAQIIWYLYNRLFYTVITFYYAVLSSIEQAKKVDRDQFLDTLNASSSDLRIPKHIALAFSNEINQLDFQSIARLLYWCKQLRIDTITLYDDCGRLKSRRVELIKHFERHMRSLGFEKHIDRVDGLNIICRRDGCLKFVEDVKDLVRTTGPKNIDLQRVQERVGWPTDPELLISFGSPLCLFGFPAWQLRLTEILSIPTHRNVPQRIFIDCLKKFSSIAQRQGA